MFRQGNRKAYAFLISISVYLLLMLIVIFSKQIMPVDLSTFSLQCAAGIMIISGAFYLGNYGVHNSQNKSKQEDSKE